MIVRRHVLYFVAGVLQLWASSPSPPPAPPSVCCGPAEWGDFVYYYTPSSPQNQIQSDFDTVFTRNQNLIQPSGQFLTQGYAFFFSPGVYSQVLNLQMGYYMSIMGLGQSLTDTEFSSVNSYNASTDPCVGALRNYWRSAENFTTIPEETAGGSIGMTWAASHGSWMRNVEIFGRLYLSQFNVSHDAFTPVGASNGAFLANCAINNWSFPDPNDESGSAVYSAQQQLLARNLDLGSSGDFGLPTWQAVGSSIWAQTFLGCNSFFNNTGGRTQAPLVTVCSNCPSPSGQPLFHACPCTNVLCSSSSSASTCTGLPATVIAETPKIVEKPWISYDGSNYSLVIPIAVFENTSGFNTLSIPDKAYILPFQDMASGLANVYVATPADSIDTINHYLAQFPTVGTSFRALILTPGTYTFSEAITVSNPNTVILGIGYPTLVAAGSQPCINVQAVNGVRVGGVILQAGSTPSQGNISLLRWGSGFDQQENNAVTSGYLYDCTARVGRFDNQNSNVNYVQDMISILAANVLCDNVWAWRADIDAFGPIQTNILEPTQTCQVGMFVRGDNVTMYGLASENASQNLTEWHGDNGSCYSYQGVFPPDGKALGQDYAFSGYQLDIASVTHHTAFDTGIYSQINDPNRNLLNAIVVVSGITSPISSDIHFFNAFTRILNGNAFISSVLPNSGETNYYKSASISYVSSFAPGPAYLTNCEWGGHDEPNAAHLSAAPR